MGDIRGWRYNGEQMNYTNTKMTLSILDVHRLFNLENPYVFVDHCFNLCKLGLKIRRIYETK